MFATIFYWIIVAAAALWGIWSLVWSIIYLAHGENGNLWIFAIINALGTLALGILTIIYGSQDNQWYWFASKISNIAWLVYSFYGYILLTVLQFIFGFSKKAKAQN